MRTGYQYTAGQSLTNIVASPGVFNQVDPAQWDVALAQHAYDLLSFEPYPNTSTIGSETTAFNTLVSAAQAGPTGSSAKYFVYEAWPQALSTGGNYQPYWNGSVVNAPSTTFTLQLAAYTDVYTSLQSTLGANIWVVPIGSVFNAIDIEARAGHIAGASAMDDFYRDGQHMGIAGAFVAACTVFTTYFRQQCSPSTTTLNYFIATAPNGTSPVVLTSALATQLASIVWSTVSNDPRAFH